MKRKNTTPITSFFGKKSSQNPSSSQSSKQISSPSINTSTPNTHVTDDSHTPLTHETQNTHDTHETQNTHNTHDTQNIHNHQTQQDEATSIPNTNVLPGQRLTRYDVLSLPHDPGERTLLSKFHPDDRDMVRREYIRRGPCQPDEQTHTFPKTGQGKNMRRFNPAWFGKYKPWLEYSVKKDAAFCFACYLFKSGIKVGDTFVEIGFRTWAKPEALAKHVGNHKSSHFIAMQGLSFFDNNKCSISASLFKQSSIAKSAYQVRLETSIHALKYLLRRGMAFRGHDEKVTSYNKGNFLELVESYAERDEVVKKCVLENAPKNCQLLSPEIQKDIIHAYANETTKRIIKDINGDFFSILADESADIKDKEQMSLCLRYVNKRGEVKERFLGIVHVSNTTSLTLKVAIESLLMEHSLTLSRVRGQGYDGASNMQGSINGLKTLIMKESPCAYCIHCFAHQLQLTLVAVAKKNSDCSWLFDMLATLLNVVGGSPRRKDILRKKQAEHVLEGVEIGEVESGSGQNQEISLSRPGDTRWGSHFKTILHVLALYPSILDVLDVIGDTENEKFKVQALTLALESFDFVFVSHLMVAIFGITNALNMALQKKDQDIVNAIALVDVTKKQLQKLRDDGWDSHLDKVTSFCDKHSIGVPHMDSMYVRPRRSQRGKGQVTNFHHFRVEVFLSVIDLQSQELDNRFGEATKELLICMSSFNPIDGFSSFDSKKLLRLAEFYPQEFSNVDLMHFEYELDNFIVDIRNDVRFLELKNVNELSIKLVETKKHEVHMKVYLLLKLVLLLPVATASVERTFSAMTYIKNEVRNSMGNQLLNDCMVTVLEKDFFLQVTDDDIINEFHKKPRRIV